MQKKLYYRHLCKTIANRRPSRFYLHLLVSDKARLRFVKVFLHIFQPSTTFFRTGNFLDTMNSRITSEETPTMPFVYEVCFPLDQKPRSGVRQSPPR